MNLFKSSLLLVVALLAGCNISSQGADNGKRNCNTKIYEGNSYFICRFDNNKDKIALYLHDKNGDNYASFQNLRAQLATEGKKLVFAMNGGMYNDDYNPTGHFVEHKQQIKKLQLKKSYGNFGLVPNGVFYIQGETAGVLESNKYKAQFGERYPDYATQSGPMLVIDGAMHPDFKEKSESINIRNGVGVSQDGKDVYFVIANNKVNFFNFAKLFRDELKTPNALYLDGSVSKVYDEQSGRIDTGEDMGVMIGVYE